MKLDPRLSTFRTALLAALGLSPFVACGGSTSSSSDLDGEEAGSGPEATGGRTSTGGRPSAGAGAGPSAGTGGRPTTPSAGTAGIAAGGTPEATGGRSATGGAGGEGGTTPAFECVPITTRRPAGTAGSDADIAPPRPKPFVECEGGWRHRPVAVECPSELPRTAELPPSAAGGDLCSSDADCDDKAHGYCAPSQGIGEAPVNVCHYGCTTDADCGDGHLCTCGALIGECIPSDCTTDADCGGLLCASYIQYRGCDFPAFGCQTPEDECITDRDCADGTYCEKREGARVCIEANCVIGRPFLVSGEVRTAELAPSRDWLAELDGPSLDELSGAARDELAEAWTQIGLLEHASVAAFARFTLELLSFGAPAELVKKSSQAMSDEIEHARKAFALASAYAAAPRGPGRLDVGGPLLAPELEAAVLTAFAEGCIGETVAALEAREAADSATDPVVCAVLATVAGEEGRHALLAYEFVKWALPRCPAGFGERLAALLDAERSLAEKQRAARLAPSPVERELVRHGILSEARRRELRCEVLREVVEPCVRTLLGAGAQVSGAPLRSSSKTAPCRR